MFWLWRGWGAALGNPESAAGAASSLRYVCESCGQYLGPAAEEVLSALQKCQAPGASTPSSLPGPPGSLNLQERYVQQVCPGMTCCGRCQCFESGRCLPPISCSQRLCCSRAIGGQSAEVDWSRPGMHAAFSASHCSTVDRPTSQRKPCPVSSCIHCAAAARQSGLPPAPATRLGGLGGVACQVVEAACHLAVHMPQERRKAVLSGVLAFVTQPMQAALQAGNEELVVIMADRLTIVFR